MKIVIDTNILISGVFFGGAPGLLIEEIIKPAFEVYASQEIVEEYQDTVTEVIKKKQGHLREDALSYFISKLDIIEASTEVSVCRDPDDNKFISCAIDAEALYIVSGDKDLLDLKEYEGIQMITAADFVEKYLK